MIKNVFIGKLFRFLFFRFVLLVGVAGDEVGDAARGDDEQRQIHENQHDDRAIKVDYNFPISCTNRAEKERVVPWFQSKRSQTKKKAIKHMHVRAHHREKEREKKIGQK